MKRYLSGSFDTIGWFGRYLGSCLLIFSLLFIWYRVWYKPKQVLMRHLRSEIATLRKQARMIPKSTTQIPSVSDVKAGVREVDIKALKKSFEIDDVIGYLLQQAAQLGLHVENCVSQGEKRKKWYTVSPILFNARGTYDAIQAFFDAIETSDLLMRCGPLSLARDENLIHVRCVVNCYLVHKA